MFASKGYAASIKMMNHLFHRPSQCTKNILSLLDATTKKNSLALTTTGVKNWNRSAPRQSLLGPISFNKLASTGVLNWTPNSNAYMLRVLFSTSSHFNCPEGTDALDQQSKVLSEKVPTNKSTKQAPYPRQESSSILGLLTSLAKFVLNIVAAILQVLVHLVKVLAGVRGEQFVNKAKNSAAELKTRALTKVDNINSKVDGDVKMKYEQTKAAVDEKVPEFQSKVDHQILLMKNSMEEFNRRIDTELPQAQTPKEKRAKFFEILKDLVKSNKVYQAVTFLFLLYVTFKVFTFFGFR